MLFFQYQQFDLLFECFFSVKTRSINYFLYFFQRKFKFFEKHDLLQDKIQLLLLLLLQVLLSLSASSGQCTILLLFYRHPLPFPRYSFHFPASDMNIFHYYLSIISIYSNGIPLANQTFSFP